LKFFEELKKRNVYKAGVAYVVTGWLLLQIVDVVGPGFGWSDSVTALLTKILLVGFPIVLVLAWLYELTPKGLRRAGEVETSTGDKKKIDRKVNHFIIAILGIAVCLLLADRVFFVNNNSETPPQQSGMVDLPEFTSSIAVLAFDDMSPDKDQEYLSDGISEEILNYLDKYKDLKVISGTSSFAYKGKDVTIDVIGEELGVAYVLEGSVRKAGDTYRITVQLIDTKDGAHIWSDTFDRKMEDVLFVQDEIAKIVAERLKLTITNEDVRLRKVDPKAYELYLKAIDAMKIPTDSTTAIGDSLIRRSLDIDPGYAPAWMRLSQTTFHQGIYSNRLTREEAIEIGMDAAQKALVLDSANIPAMNWISNWQWHNREGTKSLKTLEKLLSFKPTIGNGYVVHAYTRLGMPEKALQAAYTEIRLSPKDYELYSWAWHLERYMENYSQASVMFHKYKELKKQQTGAEPYLDELAINYFESGDVEKAKEILAKETDPYWRLYTGIFIASKEGKHEEARRLLDLFVDLPEEQILFSTEESTLGWHYIYLAGLYASLKDTDSAFESLYEGWGGILTFTELLWATPEFKVLHNDPRWKELLDRLGAEFNYDYNAP
jgi:TolB-like protein